MGKICELGEREGKTVKQRERNNEEENATGRQEERNREIARRQRGINTER